MPLMDIYTFCTIIPLMMRDVNIPCMRFLAHHKRLGVRNPKYPKNANWPAIQCCQYLAERVFKYLCFYLPTS